MEGVGRRDDVERRVVGAVGGVGADHVEGRALAVGADGQDAGRGLHVVAAQQQVGLDAAALQQLDQEVAERVGADGAGAARARAELGQRQRRAAGRARGGGADLLDELAALALGDGLHGPHEHVEHMHAERDDRERHRAPYPRSSTAAMTACWASASSTRGVPTASARA